MPIVVLPRLLLPQSSNAFQILFQEGLLVYIACRSLHIASHVLTCPRPVPGCHCQKSIVPNRSVDLPYLTNYSPATDQTQTHHKQHHAQRARANTARRSRKCALYSHGFASHARAQFLATPKRVLASSMRTDRVSVVLAFYAVASRRRRATVANLGSGFLGHGMGKTGDLRRAFSPVSFAGSEDG